MIDELSNPENIDDLKNLLLYHFLPGATLTTDLVQGPAETLFTGNQVDVGLDPTRFDNANVVTPDIAACNGYIDIIDGVLNPFPTPFCAEYTFDRRVRRLQNEGQNCNDNVLYAARLNPDLQVITNLIELAGLDSIFTCAGKEMKMIVVVYKCVEHHSSRLYFCLHRSIHGTFTYRCRFCRSRPRLTRRVNVTREYRDSAELVALSYLTRCNTHYRVLRRTNRHIVHWQPSRSQHQSDLV